MENKDTKYPASFYLIIGAYFLICGVLLLVFSKSEIHLSINQFHSPITDFIFRWITNLGDGAAATIIAIIFLIKKVKNGLLIGFSALLSGFFTQLLKHTIFSDVARPSEYFKNIAALYKVPGVDLYSFNSFPSGHAATILSICLAMALMTNKKSIHILLALTALIVSFSRVYLSQHFLVDVYFGGVLGLISVYIIKAILEYSEKKGAAWLSYSFIKKK